MFDVNRKSHLLMVLSLLLLTCGAAHGQATSFNYQGRLQDGGVNANGSYDLQFSLWDALSNGTQIGSTLTLNTVAVSNGVFTVRLDFGANAFPGADRWLETSVRLAGSGQFTPLSPRQPITSTPYAVRSLSAASADTVSVSGVPAGNGSYIQNRTSQQPASDFNISGSGTASILSANAINAAAQYRLGGNTVLSAPGSENLFIGSAAGQANTTGFRNTFAGSGAGQLSSGGINNSFFGARAGFNNTVGGYNSFFGTWAGLSTSSGTGNSVFGALAGESNKSSNENSFFGQSAGANTGYHDIGYPWGSFNSFFGTGAGFINDYGNENTMIGYEANPGQDNISNATAIGSRAQVDQSNSLVLGSIAEINGAPWSVNVGIGTTAPQSRLHVNGTAWFSGDNTGLLPAAGKGVAVGFVNNAGYIFAYNYGSGAPQKLMINGPSSDNSSASTEVGSFLDVDHYVDGGNISVCRLGARLAGCGSSLRYKTDVRTFASGLALINRLRPISFNWKSNGKTDLGLAAEDVAQVEPLLVTYNDKGEVEGVKYDKVAVVLINAIKEQQTQIEQQQKQLKQQQQQNERERAVNAAQQQQLNALKALICRSHRRAKICK